MMVLSVCSRKLIGCMLIVMVLLESILLEMLIWVDMSIVN